MRLQIEGTEDEIYEIEGTEDEIYVRFKLPPYCTKLVNMACLFSTSIRNPVVEVLQNCDI